MAAPTIAGADRLALDDLAAAEALRAEFWIE